MPDRGPRVHTGLLCGASYAGMFVFGIVMALLGAVLPALAGRLQFGVADIGSLFLVMNFGMLVCSLFAGLAMDRYGIKPPLVAGPLLVAAALALIARAAMFHELMPAVLLLGIGGGALNAATNTLIADLHDDPKKKSSALNVLGVFYGFGALFLPFSISILVSSFGVDLLLLAASALCGVVGLFAVVIRFPPPKQGHTLSFGDMLRFARLPLVIAIAALLFCLSGVEFTMGGFASTYLTRGMGQTVGYASSVLAAYWAALMIARIVLSRVVLGADPNRVVFLAAVTACAGAAFTAAAPMTGAAAVGIVFTGFALSGIFPTVLGIAGARFESHSGTVFGLLMACALTGGMTVPWLAGQAAGSAGLRWVFVVVAAAFAAISILSRVIARLS
jgi:fucose permease